MAELSIYFLPTELATESKNNKQNKNTKHEEKKGIYSIIDILYYCIIQNAFYALRFGAIFFI